MNTSLLKRDPNHTVTVTDGWERDRQEPGVEVYDYTVECCDKWKSGTDAIDESLPIGERRLSPFHFCPWCGKERPTRWMHVPQGDNKFYEDIAKK